MNQADHAQSMASPFRNRFDRMEWAGAFGDLGTLIPFVVAYIGVLKMDPFGILFSFGAAMVVCGLHYKTPFPVQPMKAVGAVAITLAAQTAVITPRSSSAQASPRAFSGWSSGSRAPRSESRSSSRARSSWGSSWGSAWDSCSRASG